MLHLRLAGDDFYSYGKTRLFNIGKIIPTVTSEAEETDGHTGH